MESVLLNGTLNKASSLEPRIINDIIARWTSVQAETERTSPQEKYFCYLKGKLLGPFPCEGNQSFMCCLVKKKVLCAV